MKQKLAQIFVWNGTRARPSHPHRTPATLDLKYEDIRFVSAHADRVELSGWLIPAAATASACVILCHGHTSTRLEMLGRAAALNKYHFTTLLFDFRARGLSAGKSCTLGFKESDDVIGAVNYLSTRADTCNVPIMALGNSMGGAAVIRAASKDKRIRAVVTEGAFASLDDVLKQRARWIFGPFAAQIVTECQTESRRTIDTDISQVCPEAEIGKIAPRPILIIEDGWDVTCPSSQSERLFAAANEPKERWIIRGVPHISGYQVQPEEYVRRVTKFLNSALAPE